MAISKKDISLWKRLTSRIASSSAEWNKAKKYMLEEKRRNIKRWEDVAKKAKAKRSK